LLADDKNATFTASYMIDLGTQINTELKSIIRGLRANKLTLNVAKFDFMIIASRQQM